MTALKKTDWRNQARRAAAALIHSPLPEKKICACPKKKYPQL
jgi:hypothetical protein